MSMFRLGVFGFGLLGLALAERQVQAEPPAVQDARALAAAIDRHVSRRWSEEGLQPAPFSDDAEFLRRAYLDLTGRIPAVWEVREFLDDAKPDKRERLIERLLQNPRYAIHFANVLRAWMLPDAGSQQVRFLIPSFEGWLRDRLRENTPYDRLVREILTLPVASGPGRRLPGNDDEPSPLAFLQASQLRPENLASSTSRIFLGVKLECAQCHNHPFARWSRKQFWEYAAFFAGLQSLGDGVFGQVKEVAERRELKIPGTDKAVQARLLDGTEPAWKPDVAGRVILTEWITAPKNPYFARSLANRLWAHFFGFGLIEPLDEPGDGNPPSHPELLDELAGQLVAHGFDLRFLIRAITLSRTYQLTSAGPAGGPEEVRLFRRMAVKALTAEQLFDSLALATGYREANPSRRPGFPRALSPRAEFLARFASQEKRTEAHTSILQALMLMNGRFIADATSVDRSDLLAAALDAPFLKEPGQRVEALYLATLSRRPRPEERERLVRYLTRERENADGRAALADVFWSLLNSSEFVLNH